jgi:hypothetical protein
MFRNTNACIHLFLCADCSLSASFSDQHGLLDSYSMAKRLGHIVNRQSRNTRPCQRLHLDASFVRHAAFTSNDCCVSILQANIYIHLVQWQWMAQWDQITRLSVKGDRTNVHNRCEKSTNSSTEHRAQSTRATKQ